MSRIRLMRWVAGIVASVTLLLLAAFLLRPLEQGRSDARSAQCRNNLKELAVALNNYYYSYGSFPPVFVADAEGRPIHSWRVLLLPFLQDERMHELYERYRFDEPWDGPNNSLLHREQAAAYSCPNDPGPSESRWTSYLAISGPGTMWRHDQTVKLRDVTDHADETLAFVEVAKSGIHWMEPRDIALSSLDEAGANWPPIGTRAQHRVEEFWGLSNPLEYAMTLDYRLFRIDSSATVKDLRPLCTIDGHENCAPILRRHVQRLK